MLKDISVSKSGDLVITVGSNGSDTNQLPLSKSGKSFVVATTNGFSNIATPEYGSIGVSINVTVPNPNYVAPVVEEKKQAVAK